MSSLDRAEARLENLEAIEPLLGSLRVLSLSTMQMALNKRLIAQGIQGAFLGNNPFVTQQTKTP